MIVTVTELIQRVRDAVDMEGNYTPDAMILRELNAVHPRFLSMLYNCQWVHNPESEDFTTTGLEQLVLAQRVLAIYGVFQKIGGEWIELQAESGATPVSENWYGTCRWRFVNHNGAPAIFLNPVPPAGIEFHVRYLPEPGRLVESDPVAPESDYVDYPGGWEEWLVLQVADKMAGREETINSTVQKRLAEVEADINSMASQQLLRNGAKVRNIDGIHRPNWLNAGRLRLGPWRGR